MLRNLSFVVAVIGLWVGMSSLPRSALARSTPVASIINPTGQPIPPRVYGTISSASEKDYWLFFAPGSGVAQFSVQARQSSRLNSRLTIVDPTTRRVIVTVDEWGWGLLEYTRVQVTAGRWYGVIISSEGARNAAEATGAYDILVSAPSGASRITPAPRWPGAAGGNPSPPVFTTAASWSVRNMPGQSSRRSENRLVSMRPGDRAEVLITGVPDWIRSQIRFTLMHDKRNASDQPRTGPVGHGSIISGNSHNWPAFGTRIYIGRLRLPYAEQAFFRSYPAFRVELRVRRAG
jgi:hypothetical protein